MIKNGCDRVDFAGQDQRRAADPVEVVEPVEGLELAAEEVEIHLRPEPYACPHIRIAGRPTIERKAGDHKGVEALPDWGCGRSAPPRPEPSHRPAPRTSPAPVPPETRKAAGDDQPRRQLRVPDCDPEADHPAKRLPKDDRPLDPEHIAARGHVVAPRNEVPATRRAFVAAPLATMVEEDEVRLILERAEQRLQRAVVESRTTMQTDHDRPLAHDRSVRDKLHPSNVEVESNIDVSDTHSTTLIRFGSESH